MPEITTTTQSGWEKRITAYCFEHMIPMSKGQIKRLALKVHKRATSYQDVDLAKVIQHSDPTGEMACGFIHNPYKEMAA